MHTITQDVFASINKSLQIRQDPKEEPHHYLWRLIYSASAAIALASLFDRQKEYFINSSLEEDTDPHVSVQHFNKNSANCAKALIDLINNKAVSLPYDKLYELAQKQLDIYERTGYCLRAPHTIIPCPKYILNFGPLSIIRGGLDNHIPIMSGLIQFKNTNDYQTFCERLANLVKLHKASAMQSIDYYDKQANTWPYTTTYYQSLNKIRGFFDLSEPLDQVYEQYIAPQKLDSFTLLKNQETCEFYSPKLRKAPARKVLKEPEGLIHLGCFTNTQPKSYFYYYRKGAQLFYKEVPKMLVQDYYEHQTTNNKNLSYLMNAIDHHHQALKPFTVRTYAQKVTVLSSFYLPATERALLELLSWPQIVNENCDISTMFKTNLDMSWGSFYLFYHAMRYLGYSFVEQDQ